MMDLFHSDVSSFFPLAQQKVLIRSMTHVSLYYARTQYMALCSMKIDHIACKIIKLLGHSSSGIRLRSTLR